MQFILLLLLSLLVSPSYASEALNNYKVAGVKVFTPTIPEIVGNGGHAFSTPVPYFVFPTINSADYIGDSRMAVLSYTPANSAINFTLGYSGLLFQASRNNLLPTVNSAWGVGSTTSLQLYDRFNYASVYGGIIIGTNILCGTTVCPGGTNTGGETAVAYATTGGFPGWKTPGSMASPGLVTVTFGIENSVNASCTPQALGGYTPFTITDSNSDTIPTGISSSTTPGCIADSVNSIANYGAVGVPPNIRSPYANFKITQPGSGPLAQLGDTINFTTFGPATHAYTYEASQGNNADTVDMEWNFSSPLLTPKTSSSNVALLIDSINDGGYSGYSNPVGGTGYGQCPGPNYPQYYSAGNPSASMLAAAPCLSMVNIMYMLDQLTSQGKLIMLGDETPAGVSLVSMESHAVTSGTTSIGVDSGSAFRESSDTFNQSVNAYGQSSGNTPGLIGVVGTATYYYTLSSLPTPPVGSYYLSGANFIINSADPLSVSGGTAYLTYSYGNTGTNPYSAIMHKWLIDTTSNFTYHGTPYNFPGAKYNRLNVVTIPLWESFITVTKNGVNTGYVTDPDCWIAVDCQALPAVLDILMKHPTTYGAALAAYNFATLWNSFASYGTLPDNTNAPTYGNIRCGRSAGGLTSYSCTMPTSMTKSGHPPVTLWFTTAAGVLTSVTESSNTFTNGELNSLSTNVNYSSGLVNIVFNSGHAPLNTSWMILAEDSTNLLNYGMFDTTGSPYASDVYTPCSGTTAGNAYDVNGTLLGTMTNLPFGWSCTVTGTFTTSNNIVWSTGYDSSGNPTLTATISGIASSAGTLKLIGGAGDTAFQGRAPGTKLRAGINVLIQPNGGHLTNIYGAPVYFNVTSNVFNVPGWYSINSNGASAVPNISALTSFSSIQASTGGISTSSLFPYTDLNINGIPGNSSGIFNELLTQPVDLSTATGLVGNAFTPEVNWNPGPVSAIVTWSRAHLRIRN